MAVTTCVTLQPAASAETPQPISITFGPEGLQAIGQGGVSLLARGAPEVEDVRVVTPDGVKILPGAQPAAHFDEASHTQTLEYNWGTLTCRYHPEPDRLKMDVNVSNRAVDPIFHLSLRLLELNLPQTPSGKAWNTGRSESDSIDNAPIVLADYGSGSMALAGETFNADYELGLERIGQPDSNRYGVHLRTLSRHTNDRIHEDIPLPAGGNESYTISLRFGPPNSTLKSMASDLYSQYRTTYPPVLHWPGRRVIAIIVGSSPASVHQSATNPRGWMNDPTLDVVSPEGLEKFHERLFAWAGNSIKILKDMDAQGMIFWDVEGEQYSNITFVGEPRMLPKLAPEVDSIADELFKKFRDAHLRTGICIRPSRIAANDAGAKYPYVHRHMQFDPVEEMSQKIDYAQKRWGCTLFYIDTNVTWTFTPEKDKASAFRLDSWPMRADMMRRLAIRHPDVLLIPELQYPGYYSHVSGYKELRGGYASTPERALLTYPDAFSVIHVSDGPIDARHADLVAAVKRGDILMFPGWYNPPINAKVKQIFEEARDMKPATSS